MTVCKYDFLKMLKSIVVAVWNMPDLAYGVVGTQR